MLDILRDGKVSLPKVAKDDKDGGSGKGWKTNGDSLFFQVLFVRPQLARKLNAHAPSSGLTKAPINRSMLELSPSSFQHHKWSF